MDWLALVKALAPIIAMAAIPGPAGQVIGPLIGSGIAEAEGLKDADGPTKKAHVIALVNDFAIGLNAAKNTTVLPVDQLVAAAGHVIDTSVEIANYVDKVKALTPPVVVPPTLPAV